MKKHFTPSVKKPGQKHVVALLCKFVKSEKIMKTDEEGCKKLKEYLSYTCPKAHCGCINAKNSGLLYFEVKSGFSNPYKHLLACIANGNEQELLGIYDQAVEDKKIAEGLGRHFVATSTAPSNRDKAIHDWIELIVMKNLPLNCVQDSVYRNFSKWDISISIGTIREAILKLVVLVEEAISAELEDIGGGKICLLHDGWSCNSEHYVALFASYNRKVMVQVEKNLTEKYVVTATLLACSPMAGLNEDEGEVQESTASFNADVHAQFFKESLKYYRIDDLKEKAVAQVADNCAVNLKIARVLGIPHVNCQNHLLASEVSKMIGRSDDASSDMTTVIDSVAETMKAAKGSLKNRALLRKLTHLNPTIDNKTRWSSKAHMLQRWLKIHMELEEVAEDENASHLPINSTPGFRAKVMRYSKLMNEINMVTVALQADNLSLSAGRELLDLLIEETETGRGNKEHPFYQSDLRKDYIAPDSEKLVDVHFISGVCKIQKDLVGTMTAEEKAACEHLKVVRQADPVAAAAQATTRVSLADKIKERKRKKRRFTDEYINCDFIWASAAVVERLWSICKYILTNQRKSLTPLMFESLVFLKVNKRFWDVAMVQKALHDNRADLSSKIADDLAALDLLDDDDDDDN